MSVISVKKYILLVAVTAMTILVSACGGSPVSVTPAGLQASPTSPVAVATMPPATIVSDGRTVTAPPVTVTIYAPRVTVTKEIPVPVGTAAKTSKITSRQVQTQYDAWCSSYYRLNKELRGWYKMPDKNNTWTIGAQATLDNSYELYLLIKKGYEVDGRVFTPRQEASQTATSPSTLSTKYGDTIKRVLSKDTEYLKCE